MPRSSDLLRRRLHRQHLAGNPLEAPEDVVRASLAVQSQDYPAAKWSVGQRVRQCTDPAVEQAFAQGRILRTHVLRPTWHFVAPDDIRWLLRLSAPRVLALNSYQYRRLELDDRVFRRCHALFERALRGGRHLTRAELAGVLRRSSMVASGNRLAYIMMHAELTGVVCSGAPRGKQHTYALLEERAPPERTIGRDEALAELVRRFFTSHAPATLKHFAWWSGLTVADAKAGLSMSERHLARVEVDGRDYWLPAGTAAAPAPAPARAYLLPEFDEALLGYRDLAIPDLPRARGTGAWRNTWHRPILIGGKRAGTWRRTIERGEVVLETNLLAPLNPAQWRALEEAGACYGEFLGLPVRLHGRGTLS